MGKIENDKYYTPIKVANHCWKKVLETLRDKEIIEVIEPSCGDGAFYHYEDRVPDKGYDIKPECEFQGVNRADFLTEVIDYKQGRLILGNPPYGRNMNLAQKFYEKSVEIADYIGFILPISQLNNTRSLYKFDLVYSEDLGMVTFTDRELHCCFNVYARPEDNVLHKKPTERLQDITIIRQDSKGYEESAYDLRMCYWGNGSAGKILKDGEHYAAEYKIIINNAEKRKEIIKLLSEFDWKAYLNCIASRKIQQFHIINVLRENIPGIN